MAWSARPRVSSCRDGVQPGSLLPVTRPPCLPRSQQPCYTVRNQPDTEARSGGTSLSLGQAQVQVRYKSETGTGETSRSVPVGASVRGRWYGRNLLFWDKSRFTKSAPAEATPSRPQGSHLTSSREYTCRSQGTNTPQCHLHNLLKFFSRVSRTSSSCSRIPSRTPHYAWWSRLLRLLQTVTISQMSPFWMSGWFL